jgi:hypothetical protein
MSPHRTLLRSAVPEPSRRTVVKGALATTAHVLSSSPSGDGRALTGAVFHDRTSAGVRQPGDPGIAGVLVSNGVDVAVTDGVGDWQLPARFGEHVFVVKPTDWSLLCGANGLPTLSRLVDESSPMQNIEFGLTKAIEPRNFEVALLADTQPQTLLEMGYLRDSVLPAVIDSQATFVINHGDIVFDRPDLHGRYLDLVAGTGLHWHHCPGNHDMNAGGPGSCFETWKTTFGPCHYAFQYGGATFILLNNVERFPGGQLTSDGYDYRGAIGRDQLLFVERILRHVPKEQLVVVSMHIPLVGFEDPSAPAAITADRRELLSLLSGRPNTLSLAGHTHTTEHHYLGRKEGFLGPGTHHHHVLTAACGSWWSGPFDAMGQPLALSRDGTPMGFHVLEVSGSNYKTRFVPVGRPMHEQVRLALESVDKSPGETGIRRTILSGSLQSKECVDVLIVANVFDGGPRTRVSCQLTGRTRAGLHVSHEFPLHHEPMTDVTVAEIYTRHRSQVKSWVEPAICSHLWRAKLPPLQLGTYVARISIADEYGRGFNSSLMLDVATQ